MPDTIEAPEGDADAVFQAQLEEGKGQEGQQPSPTVETYKIGDEELTAEQIQEALATSRQAKEIEKGARQKFDEAADMRKSIEAERENLANMRIIWDAWNSGNPEERAKIVKGLASEAGLTVAEVRESLANLNEDDFTENEAQIYRQLQAERARNDRLEARLNHLEGTVKGVIPTLEDIRQFTSSEKEARQIQSDIAQIKEKTGQDISPEQIKAWRDNGISDPVKAIDVLAPMLKNAVQTGAEKARKGNEIPAATRADTIDPDDPDVDADQLFQAFLKNQVPL